MCAYSRDWLESTPIDHTKFSAQPGNVRSHKVDVAERLENMLYGFISGETQTDEGVKDLPFVVQSGNPGAATSKIKAYAKDVSAKAEFFLQDEDANVIQLTLAGVLAIFGDSGWRTDDLLNSFSSTTPTGWTDVTTTYNGKFFRASTGAAKATSGSDTHDHGAATGSHTLLTAEIPAHSHTIPVFSTTGGTVTVAGSPGTGSTGNASEGGTGGGGSHSHTISSVDNIPAYVQMKVYEKD